MNLRHIVLWISIAFVFLFMSTLAIGKILLNEGVGFYEFFKFLTNISWSLQIIFYFYSLVFALDRDKHKQAFQTLLFAGYFQILGLSIVIYVLVNIIFQYSPELLIENFEKHGVGLVVTANSIFHGVTVLVIIIYGIGYGSEIKEAHAKVWEYTQSKWSKAFIVLYQSYGTLFVMFVYDNVVDPHDVYNVEIPDWIAWIVATSVLTCILLVYMLMIRSLRGLDGGIPTKQKSFTGNKV